ncbi:LOW QUALITY PROTEIN: BEN domain-containing protein 7 [Eucyclogobius newberryi]|uniref:LOW QUALITY PROTEIN: BEN domain-containing protein 7 n=1 Tax=Eucyclogobius newberryi TaxID=166745 RepID=UPI003B59B538
MEFGERKRSRKSQSFKLLSAEVAVEAPISAPTDAAVVPKLQLNQDWVVEDGMEIKREITGMMKILSDRSRRGYQRMGPVPGQDGGPDGGQRAPLLPANDDDDPWASVEGTAHSTLPSAHTNGPGPRSRALRGPHCTKGLTQASAPAPASAPASAPAPANNDPSSLLHQPRKHLESESEVRLVEGHEVFDSKAQLNSILINYTRSGSLLFRKLVCAFFDDATLANSLPNGKRKRGLNDNRKGLDQNIVGAVKAFTEKYCIEHKIVYLVFNAIFFCPGPRDWVQILQDQIKLARRRLRRDAAKDNL